MLKIFKFPLNLDFLFADDTIYSVRDVYKKLVLVVFSYRERIFRKKEARGQYYEDY